MSNKKKIINKNTKVEKKDLEKVAGGWSKKEKKKFAKNIEVPKISF